VVLQLRAICIDLNAQALWSYYRWWSQEMWWYRISDILVSRGKASVSVSIVYIHTIPDTSVWYIFHHCLVVIMIFLANILYICNIEHKFSRSGIGDILYEVSVSYRVHLVSPHLEWSTNQVVLNERIYWIANL